MSHQLRNLLRIALVCGTLTTIILGCKPSRSDIEPFMVDVSEFDIQNGILEDGADVEVLGCSGNLTEDMEIDFYNLVVVRSLETGDTINILTSTYFMADLNNPRERYISNDNIAGMLIERVLSDDAAESIDGKNINDLQALKFDKVLYDTEYIQVDVRHFPTVTGNLGKYEIDGDLNDIFEVQDTIVNE